MLFRVHMHAADLLCDGRDGVHFSGISQRPSQDPSWVHGAGGCCAGTHSPLTLAWQGVQRCCCAHHAEHRLAGHAILQAQGALVRRTVGHHALV